MKARRRHRGTAGRRPGEGDTRAAILDAARHAFAARGRDGATVRGIAADAGVDPALVLHYFGSKEGVFGAATELPIDTARLLEQVLPGDPEGLADRMLRFMLGVWRDEQLQESLSALVRTALADSAGAAAVAPRIEDRILAPLGGGTGRPDGELRAALAFSQGIGMAIARHLIGIRALAELDDDRLHALVEPNLRRYLSGDLGADPS
ncbi:MAG: TetR family transcriptional regulator [Solirubrobacterales bacterium]